VSLPPFQRLLDEHAVDVQRFLVAAAGPDDADDCFQETFASALRAYPRLRRNSNVRAWLLTIAQRKALDAHRSRARRAVPVGTAGPELAAPPERAVGEPALWALVRELPGRQRSAVTLRFVADLPHREIAEAIGCSEAAARRSLHEGLKKLREEWTP